MEWLSLLYFKHCFSQTRKPVIIGLNSVLFRLFVIAGRDRVIECSNTVNKIVCSTIAEYAACLPVRKTQLHKQGRGN